MTDTRHVVRLRFLRVVVVQYVCVFQDIFPSEEQMSQQHREIRKIFHRENLSLLLHTFISGLALRFIKNGGEVTLGQWVRLAWGQEMNLQLKPVKPLLYVNSVTNAPSPWEQSKQTSAFLHFSYSHLYNMTTSTLLLSWQKNIPELWNHF